MGTVPIETCKVWLGSGGPREAHEYHRYFVSGSGLGTIRIEIHS